MADRKFLGTEHVASNLARDTRRGTVYDPVENDLAVAFVIVVAVALFMVSHDSVADIWASIRGCLDQTLRFAGS